MEIKTEAFHKFSTYELSFYILYLFLMLSTEIHSHTFHLVLNFNMLLLQKILLVSDICVLTTIYVTYSFFFHAKTIATDKMKEMQNAINEPLFRQQRFSSYLQVNWSYQKTLSYTSAIPKGKTIPNNGIYKYIP